MFLNQFTKRKFCKSFLRIFIHALLTGVGAFPSSLPIHAKYSLSPVFSYSCALFCIFLHSQETQPACFQGFPHSASKNTGVWGTPSPESDREAPPEVRSPGCWTLGIRSPNGR